jgi:hypothetical protein
MHETYKIVPAVMPRTRNAVVFAELHERASANLNIREFDGALQSAGMKESTHVPSRVERY